MIILKQFTYRSIIVFIFLLSYTAALTAQNLRRNNQIKQSDSTAITKNDTIPPLQYNFNNSQKGGLFLNDPTQYEVIYDPDSGHYIFYEKIGDFLIKHPSYMTEEEYKEYRLNRDMLEYSKTKMFLNRM